MTEPAVAFFGAILGLFLTVWFAYFVGCALLAALHRLVGGDS